jgi:hypothetical protein
VYYSRQEDKAIMPVIQGRDMRQGRSFTLRLEPAQVERLEALAKQTGLSYAEVVRRLIDTAVIAPSVQGYLPKKGDALAGASPN